MSPDAKRMLEEALALPENARIDMIEALIESLEPAAESPAEMEAAWTDEIAHRLKDVETGAVKTIPWEEARRMIFGSRDDTPPR